MKKIINSFILVTIMACSSVSAQAHGNVWRNVIAATAILGTASYIANSGRQYYAEPTYVQPQPIYIQQQPVYVEQPQQYYQQRQSQLPYGSRVVTVNGVVFYENRGTFYQQDYYGNYVIVQRPF